jgi:hypothetical protein
MPDARKIVEVTTNLSILAVCGLIAWTVVARGALNPSTSPNAAAAAQIRGQTLLPPTGYRWSDHRNTLVLALRKGCGYCAASLPFHRRLEGLERTKALAPPSCLDCVPDYRGVYS